MSVHWSQLFDEIEQDVGTSMKLVADEVADDIRDRISKPVGYKISPNGRETKIRSKPGEPPRRDTGRLMSEISIDFAEANGQLQAVVYSPTPYAERLQEDLDRPITDDMLEATEELMIERIADAITG